MGDTINQFMQVLQTLGILQYMQGAIIICCVIFTIMFFLKRV